MKDTAKIESILVGLFDDAQELERAAERLAAEGFEYTIFDEALATEEPCVVDPIPVGPLLAVGPIPAQERNTDSDLSAIGRTARSRLVDYHLPDDVIETYATALYRRGKLALVRTEPELADQVTEILRDCRASRVDRHD
jgi:hypothetical protein